LILFGLLTLGAGDIPRYSAQVASWPASRGADAFKRADASCYVVKREGFYTMRCGCEGPFAHALKTLLPRYKRRFPGAFLANCDLEAYRQRGSGVHSPDTKVNKQKKHRYALQILSYPLGKRSLLGKSEPAKGCYRVIRENFEAIRCGCYESYREAADRLDAAKKLYGSAFVTYCDEEAYAKSMGEEKRKNVMPSQAEKTDTASVVTGSDGDIPVDRELLERLYLSFIYSGDTTHALQTAELALRQSREGRVKWLKRAMEAARSLGKKEKELAYTKAYFEASRDPAALNRLIDDAMGKNQYEKAIMLMLERFRLGGGVQDIPAIVALYKKRGEPRIGRDLLFSAWKKSPDHREWLSDALQISMDMGDIQGAAEIVKAMEESGIRSMREAEQVAYYYFLKRDPEKSFQTLTTKSFALPADERERVAYDRKVSGLGWMLGHYKKAAEASYRLIQSGYGNKNDYYRVIAVYQELDKKRAFDMALEALRRWETKNYFFTAVSLALQLHDDKRLGKVFEELDSRLLAELNREANYHIVWGGYLLRTGRLREAAYHLRKAYEIAPDDVNVVTALLWFYLDNKMDRPLAALLQRLEAGSVNPAYYPALVAAHMRLQQSDRARFFMRKLYRDKPVDDDARANIAYLFQAQMRQALYRKEMKRLFAVLSKRVAENPALWRDALFLDAYLRAGSGFLEAKRYRRLLERGRKVLGEARYKELSLLWDLQQGAYEKAAEKYRSWGKREPWIALSLAMHFGDRADIERLLYRYETVLPVRDRVEAARMTGQIAKAQTLAFKGLQDNAWDYLLYYQRSQLMESESDRATVEGSWSDRESINRQTWRVRNRTALPGGYRLSERAWYAKNESPGPYMREIPMEQWGADVELSSRYERGEIRAGAGIRKGMREYGTGSLEADWQLAERWQAHAGYGYHVDTEDTTWLMLGGYVDRARLSLDYKLLNSTTLTAKGEFLDYRGQDGEAAGHGWKYGISAFRVWRTGYPDIQFSFYAERGEFGGDKTPDGVLRDLMVYPGPAGPTDYWVIGGGAYVGYLNKNGLVRLWRPYFGIMPYYDFETQTGSAGAEVGVGGSFWQQDHLNLGVRYTPGLYRGQEDILTFSMWYRLLY